MIAAVEINELDRTGVVVSLTSSERRELAKAAERIGIEWREDGSARIYSAGYVGSIRLSQDITISVTTKVPVSNVLYLTSLAYATLQIPKSVGETLLESTESVIDWLAVLLITEIDALIKNGLRQDYVTVQDDLPYIRGRLQVFSPQAWARPGLSVCEFADFLPDIPENRVLRGTLEVLTTRRVLGWIRTQAEELLRSFQGVAYVQPNKRMLDECRRSRLYSHYKPALELCRLFLEQRGVELEPGAISTPAYFFPMEKVFEQAVTSFLRSRLSEVFGQVSRAHQPVEGAPVRSLAFTPDIVVGDPPRLVIDTKYSRPEVRNQYGGLSFQNSHIYQAAFYGLSLGCPAILVYPKVKRDVNVNFDIEGVSVSIRTLDLEQRSIPDLVRLFLDIKDLSQVRQVA